MNAKDPLENNESLRDLIRKGSWVEAKLSPDFQDRVWQRIRRAEDSARDASIWTNISRALENFFARPSIAFSYVIAFFIVGLTVGWNQGRDESARMNTVMEQRYVQSIDPYQNREVLNVE